MKAGLGETLLGNTIVVNHPAQFLPDLKYTVDADVLTFNDLLKYSYNKSSGI